MKKWNFMWAVFGIAGVLRAQDYNRISSGGSIWDGTGRRGYAQTAGPTRAAEAGTWGLKVGLGWAVVDWDIGPAGGAESGFSPQASLFYKATRSLDVHFSALQVSGKDQDAEMGNTEAEWTRLALGVRYGVKTQTRVTPYFGGGLGYALLDGKLENTRENGRRVPVSSLSVENVPSAFLEAGLALRLDEEFQFVAEFTYDFLLGSAEAKINGRKEDFSITSRSLNLGLIWSF
ncbi:MAG: outer membrane beta-barrel protein [Kiritimatiellia bacterium]|nr:outer membrane beta-barrel protein [Kiritimatiellia bacterium]